MRNPGNWEFIQKHRIGTNRQAREQRRKKWSNIKIIQARDRILYQDLTTDNDFTIKYDIFEKDSEDNSINKSEIKHFIDLDWHTLPQLTLSTLEVCVYAINDFSDYVWKEKYWKAAAENFEYGQPNHGNIQFDEITKIKYNSEIQFNTYFLMNEFFRQHRTLFFFPRSLWKSSNWLLQYINILLYHQTKLFVLL